MQHYPVNTDRPNYISVSCLSNKSVYLTDPFAIPEPKNLSIGVSESQKVRRSTYFDALKLWNVRSDIWYSLVT